MGNSDLNLELGQLWVMIKFRYMPLGLGYLSVQDQLPETAFFLFFYSSKNKPICLLILVAMYVLFFLVPPPYNAG